MTEQHPSWSRIRLTPCWVRRLCLLQFCSAIQTEPTQTEQTETGEERHINIERGRTKTERFKMAHCNGNWQSLVGMSSGQGDRCQCFRRAAFLAQANNKSHVSTHTAAARKVPSRRWDGERGTAACQLGQ